MYQVKDGLQRHTVGEEHRLVPEEGHELEAGLETEVELKQVERRLSSIRP